MSEYLLDVSRLPEKEKGKERHKIVEELSRMIYGSRSTSDVEKSNLQQGWKFFGENRALSILEADKGKSTILIDKEVHGKKMNEILEDINDYEKLEVGSNPTGSDIFSRVFVYLQICRKKKRL